MPSDDHVESNPQQTRDQNAGENVEPPGPDSVAVILPAAGSGRRFGSVANKLLATLTGKPLWSHSATRFAGRADVGRVIMPISEVDREYFEVHQQELVKSLGIELVQGGATRTESVRAGLDRVLDDSRIEWVAIHDAARPLVKDRDIDAVFRAAATFDAAILATPVPGTIKRDLGHGRRIETVDRRDLWIALTPQVFRVGLLDEAYRKHNGRPATDDAELIERTGRDVALVPGAADNLKITYPEDLLIAEAILQRQTGNA